MADFDNNRVVLRQIGSRNMTHLRQYPPLGESTCVSHANFLPGLNVGFGFKSVKTRVRLVTITKLIGRISGMVANNSTLRRR